MKKPDYAFFVLGAALTAIVLMLAIAALLTIAGR
jgi:hypothetical protein